MTTPRQQEEAPPVEAAARKRATPRRQEEAPPRRDRGPRDEGAPAARRSNPRRDSGPRDAAAAVDTSRPMGYDMHAHHLRRALTELRVDPAIARIFAGRSPRAGAATTAERAGARPEMIANAVGVKSTDWLLPYNRADIGDRLQESWALGPRPNFLWVMGEE